MNRIKMRYFLLGFSVLGLAIFFGTAAWLRLEPPPRSGGWDQKPLENLGRYGAVPEFSLVERSGKPTTLEELRGKVWIADFIYTSCTDTCPLQSAEMARIQDQFKNTGDFRLVSITVDPEHDRPEVLSRYAERFNADGGRWLFLTGERDEIYRLAQEGFRLGVAPASKDVDKHRSVFLHSSRFVLIDDQGSIRGYYESKDREALKRLREDARTLLKEHGV